METTAAGKLLQEYGLAAVVVVLILWLLNPKLDKILGVLFDLGLAITLLVASLPEIKKRSRDEADRLRKKFEPDAK